MEVAGLAIGVAGLFSACVDVLDKVDTYRDFDVNSKQLALRFEAEKIKLKDWANEVGIKDAKLQEPHHPRLDDDEVCRLVWDILISIRELSPKTDRLQGASRASQSSRARSVINKTYSLTAMEPGISAKVSKRIKLKWTFGGEAKISRHIQDLEVLVQNLGILVPPETNRSENPSDEARRMTDQNQDIQQSILRVSQSLHNLEIDNAKRSEMEDLKLIAEILNVPKTRDVLPEHLKTKLEGTCEWIFSKSTYQMWLAEDTAISNARFLWIHGPAGFGKTILCATIVQSLQKKYSPLVFHFFSTLQVQAQSTPEDMISIWLLEIARIDQTNRDLVLEKLGTTGIGRRLPSSQLWTVFSEIVSYLQNPVFVLDGLDEYEYKDNQRKIFLRNLKSHLTQTSSRILVTSRDSPDIRGELDCSSPDDTGIDLFSYTVVQKDNFSDLKLYSAGIIDRKFSRKELSFRQELTTAVTDRSEGMFLWVALSGQALYPSMTNDKLRRTVHAAPQGLESVYERNWLEIMKRDVYARDRGTSILRWCMFALRPLTIEEMSEALVLQSADEGDEYPDLEEMRNGIDKNYVDQEILDICASLVDTKASTNDMPLTKQEVILKHVSVKEFLLARKPDSTTMDFSINFTSESLQHLQMAKICLKCLSRPDSPSTSRDDLPKTDASSFENYALPNWVAHAQRAEECDEELRNLVITFLESDGPLFRKWVEHFDESPFEIEDSPPHPAIPGPLYCAVRIGIPSILEALFLTHSDELNSISGVCGTCLQAACVLTNDTIARMLLRWGADVNLVCGAFETAPNAAAGNGHLELLSTIIEHGGTVDRQASAAAGPLFYATTQNQEAVVKFLLKRGADVNAAGAAEWTPLHIAADASYANLLQILLGAGADTDVLTSKGWTPLDLAANNGNLDAVRMLIVSNADVNKADELGWTPIHLAAENGHLDVVRMLIASNADVNKATKLGWTPINLSADSGHLDVVRMLIASNADVNKATKLGWTSIHLAASRGYLDVVRMLIASDADVNKASDQGWTPINYAAYRGHLDVVRMLIASGADVNKTNDLGWTPINSAADKGHLNVVQTLIASGADFEMANANGFTPLASAALSGHVETVQVLVLNGVSATRGVRNADTPLHLAARKGHTNIAEFLLDNGSAIDQINKVGESALHHATYNGHIETVKLLLDRGATLNLINGQGRTSLVEAADMRDFELVKIFLDRDPSTETINALKSIVDKGGRNLILAAAFEGKIDAFETLLERGFDIQFVDFQNKNVLDYACMSGSRAMVELVLSHTASRLDNIAQWSPLHWAGRAGSFEMLGLLVKAGHVCSIVSIDPSPVSSMWSPLDIAVYCGNSKLISKNGSLLPELPWNSLVECGLVARDQNTGNIEAVRGNSLPWSPIKPSRRYCDGCYSQNFMSMRFACETCGDFDYCLMCRHASDNLHPNHKWTIYPRVVQEEYRGDDQDIYEDGQAGNKERSG